MGQKQLISVARALLKNAPLILIDEATAYIDKFSEKIVIDAIDHYF